MCKYGRKGLKWHIISLLFQINSPPIFVPPVNTLPSLLGSQHHPPIHSICKKTNKERRKRKKGKKEDLPPSPSPLPMSGQNPLGRPPPGAGQTRRPAGDPALASKPQVMGPHQTPFLFPLCVCLVVWTFVEAPYLGQPPPATPSDHQAVGPKRQSPSLLPWIC